MSGHAGERDARGRRCIVRNGYLPELLLLTGLGEVPIVSTGVKLPTYAGLKFPSLWKVASHHDLPNITPPRVLSVWFQQTESQGL